MKQLRVSTILALTLFLTCCAVSQEKLAKKNIENAQQEYQRAVVAMKYGFPDQAIDYLNQAVSLDPSHYLSYNLLGIAHLQKKNLDEAVTAFESCLKIRPDYSQALVNLGTAYEEKGLPEKAEQEYKKAFDIDANSQASFYLAKLYAKQKKLEPALDFIQKFLAKNERSAPAHNILGVILNEMGKYPEAIQSFRRALALTPQDVSLSVNLGIACINNKEFAEAREILQKALPLIEDQALKEKVKEYLELIK